MVDDLMILAAYFAMMACVLATARGHWELATLMGVWYVLLMERATDDHR